MGLFDFENVAFPDVVCIRHSHVLNLAILGGCLGNKREAQFPSVYMYNIFCANEDALKSLLHHARLLAHECIVLCNAVRFIDPEMHFE